MALAPVPDPEPSPGKQLALFEGQRPSRFQLTIGGNIDLSLITEDEGELAGALKLGKRFAITIAPESDLESAVTFEATVTKRTHKKVRHAEHGDAVVSAAVLTVTGTESSG